MNYDKDAARTWVNITPHLAKASAGLCLMGAGFAFFAAIGGVLSQQLSLKQAAAFAVSGLMFLGWSALMIGMGRWVRRIAREQRPPPVTDHLRSLWGYRRSAASWAGGSLQAETTVLGSAFALSFGSTWKNWRARNDSNVRPSDS
jgi:hypothetical protein